MSSTSIFTFLMVFSMSIFQSTELPSQLNDFGLKIQQGKNEITINTSQQSIDLAKEKFSVYFDIKKDDDVAQNYHAARLVADIDPDIFEQFEPGKSFDKIPALSAGTSMAGPKDAQYECIFFDDQAHHYIFYNNEEERRANLVSKKENGIVELSFDVENYCMQDFEINIANSNFEKLYFVFLIDENLNQKVEKGEYVKLIVNLK
ncbi:MAG: hypothetical protein AB8H03_09425 [Saprospiraceae bacterium]